MIRATSKLHIITDETNRENASMDKQLLKTWKELKCVNFINLKYNSSNDTFYLLVNKDELHAVKDFSKICVGKSYPWNDVELETGGSETDKEIDVITYNYNHILVGLLCIIDTDNVTLLIEFSEMNNVDLKSYEDEYGNNVLHYASSRDAVNILKLMIDVYQMNINCTRKIYRTPLHIACSYGHTKIIELLIEKNVDINTCDTDGSRAIHYAAKYGHKHVVDLLIEKGVNVNVTNNDGMSPIYFAAIYGHVDVIKSLIMNQADINIKDNDGKTPLDYAVICGQKNVEELLIENGADINATAFNKLMKKEKKEKCTLM